jgi:cytochrome c oxidase subunit 4
MAGHVSPKSVYYAIFGALMVFTVITVEVARYNLGSLNFPVAIGIAITKATLVILFFMHAKYSSKLTKLFVGTAFFFLAILLGLTMTDFLSRGMPTYSGGSAGAGYGVRTPRPAAVLEKAEEREAKEAGGTPEGAAQPAH